MPATTPPLAVGIAGPTHVVERGTHTFRAHASGGLGEYRYAWDVSDDTGTFRPTGVTGPVIVREFDGGEALRLRVTVTSGALRAVAVRRVAGAAPVYSD